MTNVVSLFSDTQKYEERPIVVLADDDPSIRLMVRHVLESEDFDIIEASDGLEAIKSSRKISPCAHPARCSYARYRWIYYLPADQRQGTYRYTGDDDHRSG